MLSAPVAAIAALKAKQPHVAFDLGGADETAVYSSAWAAGARWSDTTSNPIADIEAAMKKIRAGAGYGPRDVWLYVPSGLYVRHPELYRVAL